MVQVFCSEVYNSFDIGSLDDRLNVMLWNLQEEYGNGIKIIDVKTQNVGNDKVFGMVIYDAVKDIIIEEKPQDGAKINIT